MFPFPNNMNYYQDAPNFRGQGQGRSFNRRGRGRGNRFQKLEKQETAAALPPPKEKKEESKEVRDVTRVIPGLTLIPCQIQLSVSFRQVGFLTQELFHLLQRDGVEVACTCFQLYRIMLYAVAVKLTNQSKRAVPWFRLPEARPQIRERIQSALETDLRLPKPFVDCLSSIGDFELNSVYYHDFVPAFAGPHPLYTSIDNLWGAVTSLARPLTPQVAQLLFYLNNSLPGAVWDNAQNPVLQNPNDYINAAYDMNTFEDDLVAINTLNTALRKKKWPELVAEKVDFQNAGDTAVHVSSNIQDSVIRCANTLQGQVIEGNRTDFTLTSPGVSAAHAYKGAVGLYSEVVRIGGAVPAHDNNNIIKQC